MPGKEQTPLEFLLAVMNDPDADAALRARAAIAAAPFVHPKTGEIGKKTAAADAAAGAEIGTDWEELLANRPR